VVTLGYWFAVNEIDHREPLTGLYRGRGFDILNLHFNTFAGLFA
jgi:hypothetical protein